MSANDDDNPAQRRVCSTCVGEDYLRGLIDTSGAEAECDYCYDIGKTVALTELADHIEKAVEEHFLRTSTEPTDWEYVLIKEVDDYVWDRSGEQIEYLISDLAGIGTPITDDVLTVLQDRHFSHETDQFGDEGPFDREAHYDEKPVDDTDYRDQWARFETALKTEARFFSRSAQRTLDRVFDGLDHHQTRDGRPAVVAAGPETALTTLSRARVFQSDDQLEQALKHPEREVGPPPSSAAVAGRMNARGVSVFYGATDPDTALAEVRPPVGSRVVIGIFNITRPVRLLDVEALKAVFVQGSFFDPEFLPKLERVKFLAALSEQISRPVMPDDEPLEYLVTQVIADYLAIERGLDGIIYPSAQGQAPHANVVLFNHAARVETVALPEGTTFSVQMKEYYEDGVEINYWVWEKVRPPSGDGASKPHSAGVLVFNPLDFTDGHNSDHRPTTLALGRDTLDVHHVSAVQVVAQKHRVSRHRSFENE